MDQRLVDRARIFVEGWAKVQRGERVLVLADELAHHDVVRAVLRCARDTGADVTYVEMPKPESAWSEPGPVLFDAMKRAQKCLSLALVYHDRRTTIARREHGMAMFFLLPPAPESLLGDAARFPIELCTEIGRRCAARLRSAREIRVVSRRGCAFTADLEPWNCTADPGGWLEAWGAGRTVGNTPGEGSNTFPPGVALAYPTPGTLSGTAVFDHFVGIGRIGGGLEVRYEDGLCVAARGEGARLLAELVEGVEHATEVAEIAFGTNPLQTLSLGTTRNPIEAERHSGTVHVGIGPSPVFGSRVTSRLHLDGLVLKPSVYLDGEPIMEDGHLLVLDDEEVRELAARFGDPADLLGERFEVRPAESPRRADSPAETEEGWIRLPQATLAEPPSEPAAVSISERQLALVRALFEHIGRSDEGRWLLGLYRFHVEFAAPGGETCHAEIDHGRVEVGPGAAPVERLMAVRCECDLATLDDLLVGRLGPVDAGIAGRLWVSGSLGTRVLTNCTFRLLRIAQDSRRDAVLAESMRGCGR